MKFGVREICDVVLRAKARQQIGNKIFYKGEPVIYFDTLKTSSMEGAATTVYAQGGRGNARLVAWEGERTVTFTMEDALISPEGFMILSGAGLIEATDDKPVYQHMTQTLDRNDPNVSVTGSNITLTLAEEAYLPSDQGENFAYVMFMRDGEIITEPYIPVHGADSKEIVVQAREMCYDDLTDGKGYVIGQLGEVKFDSILVDFYVKRTSAAKQIEITPDKFGGNFYLEASTLFRDQNGVDMPAEFIIPNCKIQSNFTFTMASSGDPSSFTFTMDAFPDYTRFDHSKKVLAAIQIIQEAASQDRHRGATPNGVYEVSGEIEGVEAHEDLLSGRSSNGQG